MSSLLGILAARMTSTFQFQGGSIIIIFSLPRLSKANGGIRCLGRNYASSNGPVRYIPKKGVKKVDDRESFSVEVEVPGLTESRKVSNGEGLTFKVSRKDRSWVQKGEFPGSTESQKISDAKAMTFKVLRKEDVNRSWVRKGEFPGFNGGQVPDNNVHTNSFSSPCMNDASGIIVDQCKQDSAAEEMSQILDEVDDDYMEVPEKDSEEIGFQPGKFNDSEVLMCGNGRNNVEETAIQLLATRAYTVVELRKKLHSKHFPPGIVKTLINDFQKRGLINDSLYAEAFSRSRWYSSYWGPVRIKHELYKKGVNQVDAENALKVVFQDNDTHGEQEYPGQALSKMSLEHLYVQVSKQWGRSRGVPIETRRSRLVRWLQYRGFNWGVIGIILRKLESQASLEGE